MKKFCLLIALAMMVVLASSCAEREAIRRPSYKRGDEAPADSGKGRYHIVKRGETLYSIARRYNLPPSTLIKLNNITDVRNVKVGAKLVIAPGAAGPEEEKAKDYEEEEEDSKVYTPQMKGKFIWPLKSVAIGSGYGIRRNIKHDGIDLRSSKGSPIMASADGKVIYTGWGPSGYGKIVILKHDRRTITVYAHNDENIVKEGQEVKQGEQVATVGKTGRATGFHCHFEMRVDRKPVDPKKYLPALE
ncbi:MAG: M23 family metallopeptidase [Nitrospinae bacterium]|nr:M23 family metallopeptidase [Nitrospinota bacterium]